MKKLKLKILNSITFLTKKLLSFFEKSSIKSAFVFIIITLIIGQVINYYQPFKNFQIYQGLFISAIVIASWAIKDFLLGIQRLNEMIASHPIKFIGVNFLKLLNSNWVIMGIILVGGLFVYSSIRLKFIEFNFIGIYALLMIILVMITAVFGQTVYIYYIILLRRITKENQFKYNFYLPAKTEWVVHLVKKGRNLNNSFFILGFIYTLVYFLNSPENAIVINKLDINNILISTPNNTIFIFSWIVIFLIIIVAFPLYYFLQVKFTKLIVRKLKNKSINDILVLMKAENLSVNDNVDEELKYFSLINNIEGSAKYPLNNHNYIPLISSISTIGVHLIKISESLS